MRDSPPWLIFTRWMMLRKVEIKYTDMYHIENDQLVLVRKAENMVNGEVWESKSTYDNQ